MLDGYSRFEAFWRVTMPLLIPGIAATAVFALIFSWNEFVFSIFLITDPGHAHGAVRDRGPDRRHDDRLGPGGRLGDGLRPPGAAVRLPRPQAPRGRRHARGGAPLMAEVLVKSLHKDVPGRHRRRRGARPRDRRRRAVRHARPVGLRQDDDAALHRGPGGGDLRADRDRRRGRQRPAPVAARHRDGVPVLRALPAPDRARQHGVPAARGQARRRPRSTSASPRRRGCCSSSRT